MTSNLRIYNIFHHPNVYYIICTAITEVDRAVDLNIILDPEINIIQYVVRRHHTSDSAQNIMEYLGLYFCALAGLKDACVLPPRELQYRLNFTGNQTPAPRPTALLTHQCFHTINHNNSGQTKQHVLNLIIINTSNGLARREESWASVSQRSAPININVCTRGHSRHYSPYIFITFFINL